MTLTFLNLVSKVNEVVRREKESTFLKHPKILLRKMRSLIIYFVIGFLVGIVAGVESAQVHRFKRSSLSDEADKMVRESQNISINNVGQLLELVDKHQAGECLARIICELTNNPNSHGDGGNKFARALLNFRQSKHPRVKYFLEAMSNGAKAKSNGQCKGLYLNCDYSSDEIITVGNRVLRT